MCAGSPAVLRGTGSISFPGIPGPWGWGLPGDPPNAEMQQRRWPVELDSLFLEEARTFGEGRRFLPEGQRGGEPVHGLGRKEGRVEEREKSRSPFGFWTGLPLMGGSQFPVPHEPPAPLAMHSFAFASSHAARAAFSPVPLLLLLPSTWTFSAH